MRGEGKKNEIQKMKQQKRGEANRKEQSRMEDKSRMKGRSWAATIQKVSKVECREFVAKF